mmetsp:Transcript_6854/g.14265  ORF Transcript_6854/g.14265 Transcript_6854/m.14265 type:complete len:89 (-) Transcript_6854:80-346(-)
MDPANRRLVPTQVSLPASLRIKRRQVRSRTGPDLHCWFSRRLPVRNGSTISCGRAVSAWPPRSDVTTATGDVEVDFQAGKKHFRSYYQ